MVLSLMAGTSMVQSGGSERVYLVLCAQCVAHSRKSSDESRTGGRRRDNEREVGTVPEKTVSGLEVM